MSLLDAWAREYEAAYLEWERTPRWKPLARWVEKRCWKFCLRQMMKQARLEAEERSK